MTRVALYARYSSDQQPEASIEDQVRLCRLYAEKQRWTVVGSYSDRAVSGASLFRPGIQALLADALRGRFEVVLAEALDRISRDQEDVAGVFKRMAFADVKIITLSEGEISHLHVGLKGTMNALFLKDLADKTRRGLRGRIEAGKAGGGLCYGYEVVRRTDASGEPVRGERRINEAEADIVRRTYRKFAAGKSPRAIAVALNREGVPGPFGNTWGDTTIRGHASRGNGILNNELYVGRLVWNRQRFVKDPSTGRRVSRCNPEAEWIRTEVPELRIVEDALWQAVKGRQAALAKVFAVTTVGVREARAKRFNIARRPVFLLSGLLTCDCCQGKYGIALADSQASQEAAAAIRSLIGDVVLTPGERRGDTLRGELLAILDFASGGNAPRTAVPGVITNAVASPRNHFCHNSLSAALAVPSVDNLIQCAGDQAGCSAL